MTRGNQQRISSAVLALCIFGVTQVVFATSKGDSEIVRFDDRSKRVFVIAQFETINTQRRARVVLGRVQETIRESRPSWNNQWSASFFTDPKYVGYKDEPHVMRYLRDGSWSRAYIGEYDRSTNELKLKPLNAKESRTLKVALP